MQSELRPKTPNHGSLGTRAIHSGAPRPRVQRAISTPVFQSSTYEFHGESYHDVGYLRLSNSPNHQVLGERIASLEGAPAALVTSSGMAAITASLLTVLSAGDHLLVQDCLYGGTSGLITNELERLGIAHSVIDPQEAESWQEACRANTRAVYVESLSNPLVQVPDLVGVVEFAQSAGLTSVIDNTFASPVNLRPAELGFDLTIESCSKYLNGHNDLIAGSVAGQPDIVSRIKKTLDHLGGALDAHACFLLERGLKTVHVRVAEQCATAGRIAEFLESRDDVANVFYPGLASHPQHERTSRLFDGYGGMISFELDGGAERAERFLDRLAIPAVAASLGGVESLIVRPAAAVHSGLSAAERERSGISDSLIRFSVGLEGADDLLEDLERAIESSAN